jgi:hypothetical protein
MAATFIMSSAIVCFILRTKERYIRPLARGTRTLRYNRICICKANKDNTSSCVGGSEHVPIRTSIETHKI